MTVKRRTKKWSRRRRRRRTKRRRRPKPTITGITQNEISDLQALMLWIKYKQTIRSTKRDQYIVVWWWWHRHKCDTDLIGNLLSGNNNNNNKTWKKAIDNEQSDQDIIINVLFLELVCIALHIIGNRYKCRRRRRRLRGLHLPE